MTATIIAIDTATEICSVALAIGGNVFECVEAVGQRASERVLPMLHELLSAHGINLPDCDAVAFGAGPGAFTGLRIACGVAQGLAYGARKPVIAISNLAAVARQASMGASEPRRVLTVIDARMQELYWAVYDVDAGTITEAVAPSLAPVAALAELVERNRPDLVAGNALRIFPDAALRLGAIAQDAGATASAGLIAELALFGWAAGRVTVAADATPVYVRDHVALTIDERRARAVNA